MKDVPSDYYERLAEIDNRHWWARGMVEIEGALLAPWLDRGPRALLDAGCGTGAFLAWAAERAPAASLAGIDSSRAAIEVAQSRVPSAELRVASLAAIPFDDESFDIAALNDVIQHIEELELTESLLELRRTLARDGVLVVRTNGARRGYRDRSDWRLYDQATLCAALEGGGFAVQRVTFANFAFSIPAQLRGHGPRAPTTSACGVPRPSGRLATALGEAMLGIEASIVRRGHRMPWGHTLLATAVPQ